MPFCSPCQRGGHVKEANRQVDLLRSIFAGLAATCSVVAQCFDEVCKPAWHILKCFLMWSQRYALSNLALLCMLDKHEAESSSAVSKVIDPN